MPVNRSELADSAFRSILDDEQLTYLAERFVPRNFPIGATIVRTGQTVRQMHVIRRGRVILYTENDLGERVMLRECRNGEQFGEIALLEEAPSPFTAMAMEESQLLNLDRSNFEEFLGAILRSVDSCSSYSPNDCGRHTRRFAPSRPQISMNDSTEASRKP